VHRPRGAAVAAKHGRCPIRSLRGSLERRDHLLNVVIEIIDSTGLAATAVLAILQRYDDRILMLEQESCDAKGSRERQPFHIDRQL